MKTCLFCDCEELTNEHIHPDWIVELFKQHIPSRRGAYTAHWRNSGGLSRTWTSGTITHKEKLVCKPCNSVWMSQLENEASPILKPILVEPKRNRQLSELEQLTLAIWATLRLMILDGTQPFRHQYFTQSDRVAFMNSDPLAPPDDTRVWLAFVENTPFQAEFHIHSNANPTRTRGLMSLTLFLNQTGVQILTRKGEGFKVKPRAIKMFKPATIQIYPLQGRDVLWPARTYVNKSILKTFADRFDTGNRTIS